MRINDNEQDRQASDEDYSTEALGKLSLNSKQAFLEGWAKEYMYSLLMAFEVDEAAAEAAMTDFAGRRASFLKDLGDARLGPRPELSEQLITLKLKSRAIRLLLNSLDKYPNQEEIVAAGLALLGSAAE